MKYLTMTITDCVILDQCTDKKVEWIVRYWNRNKYVLYYSIADVTVTDCETWSDCC